MPKPKTRADVFQNISPSVIRTTDDLIKEVEGYTPLADHFSVLAADHLAEIEIELEVESCALGLIERRQGHE